MKLTPWFSGDQKPVRVGVYQRKYVDQPNFSFALYAYWDGLRFGSYGHTPAEAKHHKDTQSNIQNLPWRGVMK